MPSRSPVIKAYTTPENIQKMKVIADFNKRSLSKELEWLVEKHIADYYHELPPEPFLEDLNCTLDE